MTDTSSDFKPAPMITDEEEKVKGHDISGGQDKEDQAEGGCTGSMGQDSEDGAQEDKGKQELEDEEGGHWEGRKDCDEAVDALEGE